MKKINMLLITSFIIVPVITTTTALTGCTNTYHQESTGQYLDSSVITARVKSRLLKDKRISNLSITVKTYKNLVQLSGFVNSIHQKQLAERIAINTPGVIKVDNELIVKTF